MGLGVLEDRHLRPVPGTALLTDVLDAQNHHHTADSGIDTSNLRHGTGRDATIVLVPQPSASPSDPLNWPLWRKDLLLFLLCIDTAVVGAWGPMITPGYASMAASWGMSYNALNGGLGWGVFVIGVSCFFTNSAAVVWGRRPIFLLGNLLLFVSSLWGYFARSYGSLLASRLVGCVGMSPFEVLVTTTIADLYFVHQRGLRLALWGMCLSVGVGGGTIVSGYIIEKAGWNWTYGVCAIIYGVWIVVLYLFCPETAYMREERMEGDLPVRVDKVDEMVEGKNEGTPEEQHVERVQTGGGNTSPALENGPDIETTTAPRRTSPFPHSLRIFSGRHSPDSYFRVLLRPLLMLIFPQVLFSFLAYGLTTSWLIVVGGVLSQIFSAPPYNFSVSAVGLVSISALIGSILGAFVTGPLADWTVKFMARRNGGVYEPEFRLVIISVTLVLGGASFFGFGMSLQKHDPWIGPVVFYGLQYFSVGFMTIAVYGYLTDCHGDKAPEAFAAINLRNLYSFGMNYFISDWIEGQGPKEVFCIVGGVHVFICVCAVPMYVFGKRCRSWTGRVRVFQKVMNA